MDNKLTFLFGMPRSGTTWVEKVFDGHPDVAYFHEPDSHDRLDDIPLFINDLDKKPDVEIIEKFIENMPNVKIAKVMAKLPLFDKGYLSSWQKILFKSSIYSSELFKLNYLFYVPDYNNRRSINYVWKSIESLGRLNILLNLSDSYRGIQILRHPCGQIASVIKGESNNQFTGAYQSSEDYSLFSMMLNSKLATKYQLTLEALKKMTAIERLAWKWVLYNESAYNDCFELKNYSIVIYENLCNYPQQEYHKLFEHAGLSWNEQTESFLKNSTTTHSSSYYSVYKDSQLSANKWKKTLNDEDVKRIMTIVAKSPLNKLIESI